MAKSEVVDLHDEKTFKVLALLSYLFWIIALVLIFIAKDNKKWKFHAWQALFLAICFWMITIPLQIINAVMQSAGVPLFGIIILPISIFYLVIAVLYGIKAYNGEDFKIPIVYNIMKAFVKNI